MDIEVAHTQMRTLANEIIEADEGAEKRDKAFFEQQHIRATELAEACQAVDGWLTRGGFPPRSWSPAADQWARP